MKCKLLKAISAHVEAEVEKSWAGSKDPETARMIRSDAFTAKKELMRMIDALFSNGDNHNE